MKKLYFSGLLMAFMLLTNHLYAQVAVNFPTPAENLTVCNGNSLLTARISVLTASPTGVDVTIDLADGMEYVVGSVTKTGGTASLTITENGGTANVPLFKISGPVVVGDNITFTLLRSGDCTARTNSLAGMVFKDNVMGTIGASSANADSNAYSVNYASLSLNQPAALSNAQLNTNYTRTFSITNGSVGCANAVYFTISYPDAGPASVQGVEQVSLTLAGNPVTATSFDTVTNTYYYTISGADLGGDNQFCNGETLTFTETYNIKVCNAVTNYAAGWGCDPAPANWCQTATGNGNVSMVTGVPNFTAHTNTNLGYVNMCTPWTVRTTFTSGGTGAPSASTLYDVTLRKARQYGGYTYLSALPNFFLLSNATVRNEGAGTNSVILPTVFSGGIYNYNLDNFFAADPDGPGVGLEDVDGDGFFDDLPTGNTVTLDIDITIDCSVTYGCGNTEVSMDNLGGQIAYHTLCDRVNLVNAPSRTATGDANNIQRNGIATTGYIPANIEGGTPFNVRASFGYNGYYSSMRTANSRFVYVITLPAGSTASNVKWANGVYPSGTLAAHSGWTQVGNELTITSPTPTVGWATFDGVYDCSGGSSYNIDYKVYDVNDITAPCNCLSEIACGTLTTLAFCPGTCAGGPTTGVPVVRRADNSLGWTDYTMVTRQIAANISSYDLSKALYLDEIEISGNGVQNGTANDLFVEMVLPKAGSVNKLTPLDVYIEIERAGSVVSSATLTSFIQTNSTATKQVITWDLTAGLPVGGLIDADIIRTKSRYQVAINDGLPQQDIQSGELWTFFNTDGAGNRLACNSNVPEMYLVGTRFDDASNAYTSSGCTAGSPGNVSNYYARRFNATGVNFLSEYRPGGYITEYQITIPEGYSYLSCRYSHANGGGDEPMIPDAIVGNTYTFINPGTWEPYRTTVVNAYGARIIPILQPNCGAASSTDRYIMTTKIKDFYYHYADPTVTTYDRVSTKSVHINYTNSPSANISDITGLVQASAPVESWRVRLNNPSLTTAPYTWIAIPDVAGVNIVQLIDEATMMAVPSIPYTGGKMYHLDAAGITSGQSKFYTIQFSYSTCVRTDVEVLSGWDCGSFVLDPNDDECGTMSMVTLGFQPQQAEVAIIPVSQPTVPVALCQATPFQFNINSAQAGNVVNSNFAIYTVPGLTPTAGSFMMEYPAGAGNWEAIAQVSSGTTYTYDLTTHSAYPISGIPGTNTDGGNPLLRQIGVRFTVDTDCDFAAGSNFQISAGGDRACGLPAIGDDSKVQTAPISIAGVALTYLVANTLALDAGSAGDFTTCGTPITLSATHTIVELVGGATTGANGWVEVRLPLGYQYVNGSYTCTSSPDCATLDTPAITTGLDGAEILNLLIPAGLTNADVLSYTLQITENLSSPAACGDDNIELITFDEATNVPCVTAPGGQCSSLKYQTGSFSLPITVDKAVLNIAVASSTAVVSATDESVTVNYSITNTAMSDAPAGVVVDAFFDVNNNGTYESAFDYYLGNHLVSVDVPAGGTINDSFTFTATPAQVCDLLLVIRESENPCICSGSFATVPSPTILSGVAGADRTICEVETTQLGLVNNTAYTYSWAGATATETAYLSATNIAQPVFDYSGAPLSTTTVFTYTVTITRVGGCSSTDTVDVTVHPTPAIPTGSATQTFCGSAIVGDLVASSPSASVVWYDAATGGNVVSNLNTLVNGATYYGQAVGSSGSCPSTARLAVTVTITPTPSAGILSGTQNVCVGSNTTFSSSVSGGTWSSSNTAIATVDASGLVSGVSAGSATITYTVTASGCPDATATRTVTVTAAPNAGTLSGAQGICTGATTTFVSSGDAGGTWSTSNPFVATVDASGVVTGNTAGTATITYTVVGTGGCADATATRTVTVTAAPNAGTLSGTQAICVGSSTTFTSNGAAAGAWSSSNMAVASVDATGLVTGISAGTATITYTVTGTGGCADATATRTVTVTAAAVSGIITGTTPMCAGTTANFTSPLGNPGGTWSTVNPFVASIDPITGVLTANSAGTTTVKYTVTGTGGCSNAESTFALTVNAPVSAGSLSGNQNVCIGNTTVFSASVGGGTWASSDTAIATVDASGVVTGVAAGLANITYTVTGTPPCSDAVASRTVTVSAPPSAGTLSGTQALCTGTTTTFSSTVSGGSWSSSNPAVAVIDPTTGLITANAAGTATMTYLVSGGTTGCPSASATRTVTVTRAPNAGANGSVTVSCTSISLYTSLTGSPDTGGTWSPALASGNDIFNPAVDAAGVYTYTVVGVAPCGNATATVTVTNDWLTSDCDGDCYTNAQESAAGTDPFVFNFNKPANGSSVVSCPAAATIAPVLPSIVDNCGRSYTLSAAVVSSIPTCEGDVTYTYTYQDFVGTTHTWVYTYTIERADFTMPADASSTVSCIALAVAPTLPTVTDACGNTLSPVTSWIGGTYNGCEGTRIYYYQYEDCEGNDHYWSYTYTIEREDFVMPANAGSTVACASEIVLPSVPTITDNCGNVLTPSAPTVSAVPACEGAVTYTYAFTDCEGNTHDWVYTYTIERDDFMMPANAASTVACAAEVVAPMVPEVTDACGNLLTPSVPVVSTMPTCEGDVTYTYTFVDCEGNTHDWVYTYTIEIEDFMMPDNAASTVACVADIVAPTVPTVTDNCGNTLTASAPVVSTTPACEGDVTYTYTFTDCEGNTHDWVYTYTVERDDFTMPANAASTVACPADIVAPTVPTVTDNCGNILTPSAPVISQMPTCEGDVTYTYTFEDCEGNTHDWVYTYTIEREDFVMPADAASTVSCIALAVAPTLPTVTDACGNTLSPISSWIGGTYNGCEGTRIYYYEYEDCEGNDHNWAYTYTIERADFTMPANASSTVACVAEVVAPMVPVVTDHCGNTLTPSAPVISAIPTCEGDVTYTYTFTDCEGNTHDWVYTYTIERNDFNMPANASSTVACVAEVVAPTVPVVTDACGNLLIPSEPVVSTIPTCEGDVTYTYTFTDCEGNTHDWVYTYTIEIEDFIMPANAASTVACVAEIVAPITPTVVDNCGNVLTPSEPVVSASPACEGTVTYTYTYTDCEGNTHDWVYTYTIEKLDFMMPSNAETIVNCPSEIVTPVVPTVTDYCGNVLTPSAPVISEIPTCEGEVTYTYTFTDCEGNTHDWVYTYIVDYQGDLIAPANEGSTVYAIADAIDPGAPASIVDACGRTVDAVLVGMTTIPSPFECDGQMIWTYRYTACDGVTVADWTYTYTVITSPDTPTGDPNQEFCVGDHATVADLEIIVPAGITVVWYDSSENGNVIANNTLLADGYYFAEAVNANGCVSIDRFTVHVILDTDCDDDGVLDVEEVNGDTDGDGTVDYLDTDDDGDGILTFDEDSNTNQDWFDDDCNENDVVDYLDPQPCDFIPNAFSPNGDGDNDEWVIPALAQYPDFTLEIYDRWGNIVYEYANKGQLLPDWWDGTSNGRWNFQAGEILPTGTYFYIINYNEGTKEPSTGWVYLQNNND